MICAMTTVRALNFHYDAWSILRNSVYVEIEQGKRIEMKSVINNLNSPICVLTFNVKPSNRPFNLFFWASLDLKSFVIFFCAVVCYSNFECCGFKAQSKWPDRRLKLLLRRTRVAFMHRLAFLICYCLRTCQQIQEKHTSTLLIKFSQIFSLLLTSSKSPWTKARGEFCWFACAIWIAHKFNLLKK